MKLALVADELLKTELLSISPSKKVEWVWLNSVDELNAQDDADAVIDLLFSNNEAEVKLLKEFLPRPVIVNSVLLTLKEINYPFIRINAWPGFLKREITEATCNNEAGKIAGEKIFSTLGRKVEWVPDITGFISPRVIAMIINEAYFALEEKVSTKEEIDTAMKLGTNYPFGPFEWADKIGLKNIFELLNMLSLKEKRYQPAPLLIKEAGEK
jgi:3-hydroxybutyryl-CoA dehydrogenase